MVSVVAALIEKNNRILLFQRPPHKARGMKWEFPGGKVETGERPEDALIRECREELNISVSVLGACAQTVHRYPDVTIELILLRCRIDSGTVQLREHIAMAEVTPEEAALLDLAAADRKLLNLISF